MIKEKYKQTGKTIIILPKDAFKEFEQSQKDAKHSLEVMLRNYRRTHNKENSCFKRSYLDRVELIIDNFERKGYDIHTQKNEYEKLRMCLEW